MQRHRPTLGPPDQLGDVDLGGIDLGALQERAGLLAVHREVVGAELHDPPLGLQAREWQRRLASAGDGDL